MTTTHDLLIVGASARAAAHSAIRAGLRPTCLDYFADRDLKTVCALSEWTCGKELRDWSDRRSILPPATWLYTGPLENHPERVERISTIHRLCGNPAGVLCAARDPCRVVEVLRRHRLPHPQTRPDARGLPLDGTWLVKPLASAGGRLAQLLTGATVPFSEPSYFQQFVSGPSHSALYLAVQEQFELIGVTQQLLGAPGSPFAYQGNIGPIAPSASMMSRLRQLGNVLTSAFGLVGLFGLDFVEYAGEPWPVEINPRYTASVEVLEMATRRHLLAEHLHACGVDRGEAGSPGKPESLGTHGPVVGKAIVYARRNLVTPEIELDEPPCQNSFIVPSIADIPWPGTEIAAGEPVMTIFATGEDARQCTDRLAERELWWRGRLKT